jgi:hypothetical protein
MKRHVGRTLISEKPVTKNRKKTGFYSKSGPHSGGGKQARRDKKKCKTFFRTRSGFAARRMETID